MSTMQHTPRFDAQRMREANEIQAKASDPSYTVWVSASAGTGKTELLARRVFRLLLADPTLQPDALVALTFTRHGASEIARRLREKLEKYATDPALAQDELKDAGTPERWAALQAAWRTGPVLVTTIHGLAQRSLQRVGQGAAEGGEDIQLLNEHTQRAWLLELQKTLLADTGDRLAHLAPLLERLLTELGEGSWKDLTGALLANWPKLTACLRDGGGHGMQERLQALLGVGPHAQWARQRVLPKTAELAVLATLAAVDAKVAPLWQALQAPEAFGADALWQKFLLTEGKPRKSLFTKGQRAAAATVGMGEADLAILEEAMPRVAEQVRLQHAWRQWELSTALVGWAAALKEAYEAQKAQAGVLDYQDVLNRFEAALADPLSPVAARLERQYRHLLLDEGQDNSPQQDRIIRTLCRNLLAGDDGRQPRTVLAVGDVKQSIFRFQGAAPELFVGLREELQQWAGTRFREVDVGHNFRSLPGILAAVDTVFAEPDLAAAVQGELKDWPTHTAVRVPALAKVALWCGVAGEDDDDTAAPLPAWSLPEVRWLHQKTAPLLPQAEQLAAWLPSVIGQTLPGRKNALTWQNVLVLVPSNKALLLLAGVLQQRGIPIGRVTGWVAPVVADAAAYLRVLAAPGDTLSLATMAKSPHGWDWDDAQLLALQAASVNGDWEVGLATLAPERMAALTNHRALARILTPAALLWRLADDFGWPLAPLTGLLQWASAAPTLLHLIARAEQEPLPEGEGDADGVRLLTVHKAKGLQAPLVVLFNTANNIHHGSKADKLLWDATHNTVLVQPKRGLSEAVDARLDEAKAEKFYDHMRLLYVAMTRAEHWLVALGPNPASTKPVPDSWWDLMTKRLPHAMVTDIQQPQRQD
jgi:ATP-dependent helicase/nuclease subunit A